MYNWQETKCNSSTQREFHHKCLWLTLSLWAWWLHFTWLRGQTQSTLVGEFSRSELAERRFLQHRCWLENESDLLSLVELKYSIVILSEVNGTQGIQNQMTNDLVITLGSYYDAIISNCNKNIPYSQPSTSKYFFWNHFLTFSKATLLNRPTDLTS